MKGIDQPQTLTLAKSQIQTIQFYKRKEGLILPLKPDITNSIFWTTSESLKFHILLFFAILFQKTILKNLALWKSNIFDLKVTVYCFFMNKIFIPYSKLLNWSFKQHFLIRLYHFLCIMYTWEGGYSTASYSLQVDLWPILFFSNQSYLIGDIFCKVS